jgi:hypothetical protein
MTFVTSNLSLAAYLVASNSLEFHEIELAAPNKATFVFHDPLGRGAEIEKEFWKGAMVNAVLYHTQVRILRRAVDDKTSAARLGAAGQTQYKYKGNSNVHFASSTQR